MLARFRQEGWNFGCRCALKVSGHRIRIVTVNRLSKLPSILWLALFALLTTSVHAERSSAPSASFPDSRTLKVQRKVDELFERGEFDRAYFIYRNELVPLGDKYAQYMVGFMHLTGMGIDEDAAIASAWYRLAAERGTPEFIAVRDLLMQDLEADQHRRSDLLYQQIRREFCDLAILLASIKRDIRELKSKTGSRIAADSSSMTVIEATSPNQSRSSTDYYSRIRKKLEERLIMLSEIGEFPDLETDPTRVDIDDIERLVNERIESTLD